MRVLCAGVWLAVVLLGAAPQAHAQHAIDATTVYPPLSPGHLLTLRPEAGLRALAEEVAAVLELRTGQPVEVGEAPPPGLLEAVPTGHIAMARRDGAVVLVLGAPGGRSLDATVRLDPQEGPADARALALAAEDLRDTAAELARRGLDAPSAPPRAPELTPAPTPPLPAPTMTPPPKYETAPPEPPKPVSQPRRDDGDDVRAQPREPEKESSGVEPLLFVRLYGGASSASTAPATGVGTGAGLCVERHCLVLGAELPLTFGGRALDLRYRYPTFSSSFYTRPFVFGDFSAGATLGLLTRLGHFRADMGLTDDGLDTDLGARGSVELGYTVYAGIDLLSEVGVDFTIDRRHLASGERVVRRGDAFSPWGQLALRVRP